MALVVRLLMVRASSECPVETSPNRAGRKGGAKQPNVFLFDHHQLPSHFYAYFVKP